MPGTVRQDGGTRMVHVGQDHYRVSYRDTFGDTDGGSQHLNSEGASFMKPTMAEVKPVRRQTADLAVSPGQGTLDLGQLHHAPGDLARAGHHLGILHDNISDAEQANRASKWTSPMQGQGVLPIHSGAIGDSTEIDAHGNNQDAVQHPGFKRHGPQMSQGNAYLWNRYGSHTTMKATTPITTQQTPEHTGDTGYIRGELNGDAMRVGVVRGQAMAFDGHHRTQQLRGRGSEDIPIHHLDIDALEKEHGSWAGALVAHGFGYDGKPNRTPGLEHELTPEQLKSPAPLPPRGAYAAAAARGEEYGGEPVRQGKPRVLAGAQFGEAQPAFGRRANS